MGDKVLDVKNMKAIQTPFSTLEFAVLFRLLDTVGSFVVIGVQDGLFIIG